MARYWRIRVRSQATTYVDVEEMEWRATVGGVDLSSGASVTATSTSAFTPANIVDDTTAYWISGSQPGWSLYINFDFGSDVYPVELAITVPTVSTDGPLGMQFEYSDDGVSYTTTSDYYMGLSWSTNETKTFTVTPPAPPASNVEAFATAGALEMDGTAGTASASANVAAIAASGALGLSGQIGTATTSAAASAVAQPGALALVGQAGSASATDNKAALATAGALGLSGSVGSAEASGGGGASVFRYWRILCTGKTANDRAAFAEIEFLLGGVDQATAANTLHSGLNSNPADQDATDIVDNNAGTSIQFNTDANKLYWIQIDFGGAPSSLDQITVQATNNGYITSVVGVFTDMEVQYSDDGTSWTTTDTYSALTWSTSEKKTFAVTAPAGASGVEAFAAAGAASLDGQAGNASASAHVEAVAGPGAARIAGQGGVAAATAHVEAKAQAGSVALTGLAGSATATAHVEARAASGAVDLAGAVGAVSATANVGAIAGSGDLRLVGAAGTAVAAANVGAVAGSGSSALAGQAGVAAATAHVEARAASGAVTASSHEGTASVSANVQVQALPGSASLSGQAGQASASTPVGAPTIAITSGSGYVGSVYTATPGTGSSGQWRADGVDIPGETALTFTMTVEHEGAAITFVQGDAQESSAIEMWVPTDCGNASFLWIDPKDGSTITLSPDVQKIDSKANAGFFEAPNVARQPSLDANGSLVATEDYMNISGAGAVRSAFVVAHSWLGSDIASTITPLFGSTTAGADYTFIRTNNLDYTVSMDGSAGNTGSAGFNGALSLTSGTNIDLGVSNTALQSLHMFSLEWDAAQDIDLFMRFDTGSTYIGSGAPNEVILLDTVLSQADRRRMEGYLHHRWNTPALPVGHEYRTAAPQVAATAGAEASALAGSIGLDGQPGTAQASGNVAATAGAGALQTSGRAGVGAATDNVAVAAAEGALTATGFPGSASASANVEARGASGVLSAAGTTGTASITDAQGVYPIGGALGIAGQAGTASATANVNARPAAGAAGLSGSVGTAVATDPQEARAAPGSATIGGAQGRATLSDAKTAQATAGSADLTGAAGIAGASANKAVQAAAGAMQLAGRGGVASATAHVSARAGSGGLRLVGSAGYTSFADGLTRTGQRTITLDDEGRLVAYAAEARSITPDAEGRTTALDAEGRSVNAAA